MLSMVPEGYQTAELCLLEAAAPFPKARLWHQLEVNPGAPPRGGGAGEAGHSHVGQLPSSAPAPPGFVGS